MMEDNLLTEENEAAVAVPEKFRDAETGKIRLDKLVQSYQELERKLSAGGTNGAVNSAADGAVIADMPDGPDGYEIALKNDVLEVDPEVNQRLYDKGFTKAQAQEVYDLAAEKLMPVIIGLAQEMQADREIEKLEAEFGGPEKWTAISKQLLAYGRENLAPDLLESMASSYEGVMALYRMMKSDEPNLSVREADVKPEGEEDLRAMMRDPRYWRQKDPAFVGKVTEGFRKMYGQGNRGA